MRTFVLFCLFASLVPLRGVLAADDKWTLVPAGRLFPITIADPREIRTAVTFSTQSKILASVGSYLSIFSVQPEDGSWKFHFGLEGRGYFTMRQQGGRFPLETLDGTIGAYTEYAQGDWQFQLRYTHVSAHLADGSTDTPIAFSRETVSLRAGYTPDESLQLYAGVYKIVHTMPVVPAWALQLGWNYFIPWGGWVSPYIAGDLRWQGESRADPCFSLQLGVALHDSTSFRRSFRVYYSYYTGADVRGQYYNLPSTIHSVGIEFPL